MKIHRELRNDDFPFLIQASLLLITLLECHLSFIVYGYADVLASTTSIGRTPLLAILYPFQAPLHDSTNAALASFIQNARKRLNPFFIFFSRCPVCGEWCKLHWLLLDTPSFDWLIDRLVWYIKDSNITSGAQRNIFEKGAIFFGHPVLYWDVRSAMSGSYATCHILSSFIPDHILRTKSWGFYLRLYKLEPASPNLESGWQGLHRLLHCLFSKHDIFSYYCHVLNLLSDN